MSGGLDDLRTAIAKALQEQSFRGSNYFADSWADKADAVLSLLGDAGWRGAVLAAMNLELFDGSVDELAHQIAAGGVLAVRPKSSSPGGES